MMSPGNGSAWIHALVSVWVESRSPNQSSVMDAEGAMVVGECAPVCVMCMCVVCVCDVCVMCHMCRSGVCVHVRCVCGMYVCSITRLHS